MKTRDKQTKPQGKEETWREPELAQQNAKPELITWGGSERDRAPPCRRLRAVPRNREVELHMV